jgi:peptidyl-prolyl cis-trans isomerase C
MISHNSLAHAMLKPYFHFFAIAFAAMFAQTQALGQNTLSSTSANVSKNIVTWSNGSISENELRADLLRLPADQRVKTLQNPQSMSQVMDNLHVYKSLAHAAESSGFTKDPLMKAATETAIIRTIGSLYMTHLIDQEKKKLGDLTPAAREQYLSKSEKYMQAERVSAAHILIADQKADDAALHKRAIAVREELIKGGNFFELAGKYSADPGSRQRGGELGEFPRGAMVKPFEDAAFALSQPGQLSEPIKTQFGYHIIKLNKHSPAGKQSFDEVKESIINELTESALNERREKIVNEIRKDSTIKIDDAAFEALTGAKRIK